MSLEELNFKRLAEEKHRVYRILRASPNVIATYRHYIAKIGKYRGAIVFPEQFIAMGDSYVYVVSSNRERVDACAVTVSRLGPFALYNGENKKLKTVDDVIEVELAGKLVASRSAWAGETFHPLFVLKNGSPTIANVEIGPCSDKQLAGKDAIRYWFSNKNDAMSFAKSQIVIS